MIDREQVGIRIASLRKKAGWPQAALAEKLNVSIQAVSKWENGGSIPDIELLCEIAWLFETTVDALIEGGDAFLQKSRLNLPDAITALLPSPETRRMVESLLPYCSDQEILTLSRELATGKLNISLSAQAERPDEGFEQTVQKPAEVLSEHTLRDTAPFFARALGESLNRDDAGLRRMSGMLICPQCGKPLSLTAQSEGEPNFLCPEMHCYEVVDGVIDFGSREIPGELWSQYFRNYDHYLREQQNFGNPNNHRGDIPIQEVRWQQLKRRHPRVILDVACGTGSGIKYDLQRINWSCLVILADLSHRVLKYNRKYFSEKLVNPHVDIVCLACDCAHLPLVDGCIDAVVSNAGFESMQDKMDAGFREAHRVLKNGSHALYTMSILDSHQSPNTQKWIRLMNQDEELRTFVGRLRDIDEWKSICLKDVGYASTEAFPIFGELPAPECRSFPFENEVLQWMGQYVCVSAKRQ